MMQVWLVLLGAVLLWWAGSWAAQARQYPWAFNVAAIIEILGAGCLIASVVTFFVNGGTVG